MKENLHISNTLDAIGDDKANYDKNIKELLADKQVLSRILKYAVEEFRDMPLEEISASIGNDIEIGTRRLDAGQTNRDFGKIQGDSTEDSVLHEGYITYDIRFTAWIQKCRSACKILLNLEAQTAVKPEKLRYHLENRIIFYLCRMVSAQKETEFFGSDYDGLKKVVSIWICIDNSENGDSVIELAFGQKIAAGNPKPFTELDKMRGIVIRIRDKEHTAESQNQLISMLEDLIRKDPPEIKRQNLVQKHGFKMSRDIERKVADVCNWSDAVEERAIREGLQKGMERGMQQGMQQERISMLASYLASGAAESEAKRIFHVTDEEVRAARKIQM